MSFEYSQEIANDYEKLFEKNNIKLEYQHYVYPQYQQHLSRSFVPDLSIIDMLANVGPDCMRLINETNSNLMELKHWLWEDPWKMLVGVNVSFS